MHDGSHIGETCPECGTHHRVVGSIPPQPLTRSLLEDLRASPNFTVARGVGWTSGESVGFNTDEEVTEEIVLATETKALLLRLYDPGWVVELEAEPREDDDETVEDVATEMWSHASHDQSAALHEMLELVCSLLDPTYDCPDCDYHKTGATTLAHDFLSHLTDDHGYTGHEALSILEDRVLDD